MTLNTAAHRSPPFDMQEEWDGAKLIYPLYCAMARECVIDVLPCRSLETEAHEPTEESLEIAREWFSKLDDSIQVHQLRHYLQTTNHASVEALQAIFQHHIQKPVRDGSDRNKVDFLLVQVFSLCIPSQLTDSELDLASVATILEPMLGTFELDIPEWLDPLEDLARKSENCRTLKELFTSRIIEQGRSLKESCGEKYFLPNVMAAFTRFGFLLRRTFFRLMHQDLNAILDGLRELESRGVEGLDCRKAQFSAYEPMLRLRMICQSWKVMFHAEYSSGQPLCLLVDLRTVVDAALVKTASSTKKTNGPELKGFAAAAGSGFSSSVATHPEFEVSHPACGNDALSQESGPEQESDTDS